MHCEYLRWRLHVDGEMHGQRFSCVYLWSLSWVRILHGELINFDDWWNGPRYSVYAERHRFHAHLHSHRKSAECLLASQLPFVLCKQTKTKQDLIYFVGKTRPILLNLRMFLILLWFYSHFSAMLQSFLIILFNF